MRSELFEQLYFRRNRVLLTLRKIVPPITELIGIFNFTGHWEVVESFTESQTLYVTGADSWNRLIFHDRNIT